MRAPTRERGRLADRTAAVLAGIATALILGFVLLPIIAIFSRVPPGSLVAQLHSEVAIQALLVSLKTSLIALALVIALGTPAAFILSRTTSRWGAFLTTILELPLVLPPAVAGIGLLAAFGRAGLLGSSLRALGIEIPFTQVAVVMALSFVAIPFYVRQAIVSFGAVDPQLLAASRTLGAGRLRTFGRVALPMAMPGLTAGATLAWARALGEFGATIMFAGSFQGVTQTLSLAIYTQFEAGSKDATTVALAMAGLLVIVSAGLLVGVKLMIRRRFAVEGAHADLLDPTVAVTA
jgi:molybdate transport system permease protein